MTVYFADNYNKRIILQISLSGEISEIRRTFKLFTAEVKG